MKKNIKIKLLILSILVFFSAHNVLAANLDLNVEKNTLQEDEVFTLVLSLNTDGESINTLEGDLKYDENFFKMESVNIGGSFVSFWVEKPDIKTLGTIHFSGITPGGISSPKSEVFKVIFRTQKIGETIFSLKNVSLFLNDGKGTIVPVKIKDTNIKINQGKSTEIITDLISQDKVSPEEFTITRTNDKSIFDDKYFIVFSATDKESGVDSYQVCEFFKCITAESPFLLKNQSPFYRIVVNAYDLNGNFVSSTLTSPWLIVLFIALFLALFALICVFYRKYL
jgi:hypothetical protein